MAPSSTQPYHNKVVFPFYTKKEMLQSQDMKNNRRTPGAQNENVTNWERERELR